LARELRAASTALLLQINKVWQNWEQRNFAVVSDLSVVAPAASVVVVLLMLVSKLEILEVLNPSQQHLPS
jgi:hypothetical protein